MRFLIFGIFSSTDQEIGFPCLLILRKRLEKTGETPMRETLFNLLSQLMSHMLLNDGGML